MDNEVAKAKEQKKTNALFVLSCARGYIEDAKTLLDRGADPDAVDKQKISGLHFACGQGRLEVVKFLWARGMELDAEDPAGNLPLHYAVIAGKAAVVDFLLSKGAWVEGSNSLDDTPLHISARKGHLDIVKNLLEHGAKATLRDVNKRGLTALGEAIVAGNVPVAEELVKAGANLSLKARGFSHLHLAASVGSAATVRFLLGRGAKANEVCFEDGNTPLHCAAEAGNLQAAKLLVEAGGDKSLANVDGKQAQDLVPGSDKQLKSLLATTAPAKGAAVTQAARSVPKNDVEDFKALDDAKRKARIERWAAVEDPQQLEKLLLEFPLELKTQIQELLKLRQILNIQQALLELVDDDDFQKLAESPKAQEVVGKVHSNPQLFRQYAENEDIMELLRALQRFQAVVRGNGGHQIPFQSLLRTCEEGYQEKSRMRLKGMQLMMEARQRAAIAAALADSETEAKTNAAKEMEVPARPPSGAAAASDTAAKQTLPSTAPRFAARQTASQEGRTTAAFGQPQIEPSPGAERQPVTLKLLGKEILRALRNSLILLAIVLVIGYFTNRKAPWEGAGGGQKSPAGINAEL